MDFEVFGTAADILRGTVRHLRELDAVAVSELPLPCGRRLDLLALHKDGSFTAIEIKSCRADFMADRKWGEYLGFADRFCFAVAPDFPQELLPGDEGLIVADRFGGTLVRTGIPRPLAPARRKALTLRFARIAAARLMGQADPGLDPLPG